jgi:hypothetical protein
MVVANNKLKATKNADKLLVISMAIEEPQFPGDRQTPLELALALTNTTKSSTRVFLLSYII